MDEGRYWWDELFCQAGFQWCKGSKLGKGYEYGAWMDVEGLTLFTSLIILISIQLLVELVRRPYNCGASGR